MTPIFKLFISIAISASPGLAHASTAAESALSSTAEFVETYEIISIEFKGLQRTNPAWLTSYIDLSLPAKLTRQDAKRLQRRLLTTAVFSEARVVFTPAPGQPSKYLLQIDVVERWTTIPVIRAVYGGGTPLRVLGLYDIHVLGRLLTVGGEAQKYGNAPIGSVLYAKSPRHDAGRYFLGSELWREYRRRPIYDPLSRHQAQPRQLGILKTDVTMGRFMMLRPWTTESTSSALWRIGTELMWFQERTPIYEPTPSQNTADLVEVVQNRQDSQTLRVLPTLMYDDIDLNILDYDGLRAIAKLGPSYITRRDEVDASRWHSFGELEVFWFKLLPSHFNVGFHAVVGGTSYGSIRNQYFLGGLDSVRGFPDGLIQGRHASWFNLEMRHTSWKPTYYTWAQSVAFCDAGAAANTWHQLDDDAHAACGVGVRLAVPQVNRLIFRLDYAWAIDGSGQQGITAGMNQFFDPFKPLSDR